MLSKRIFRLNILVLLLITTILFLFLPGGALAQSVAERGSLLGFVYGADKKVPLENAVVKIRHLKERKEYQSSPTDENGIFQIQGIEEGRYILGVTSRDENFNFDYSIFIKAKETAFLSFGLQSGSVSVGEEEIEEGEKEIESFFSQPAGSALFDSSIAESVIGIYGTMCPDPRCCSPNKRFWRWLLWWLRRHWRWK